MRVYDLNLTALYGNGGVITVYAELQDTPIIIRNVKINSLQGVLTLRIVQANGCTVQRLESVKNTYAPYGSSNVEGITTVDVNISGSLGKLDGTGGIESQNIGTITTVGEIRGRLLPIGYYVAYLPNDPRGPLVQIASAGKVGQVTSSGSSIRADIGGADTTQIQSVIATNGTIGVPTGSFSSISAISTIGDIVAQSVRANIAVGYDSARSATAQLRKLQTTSGGFTGLLICNQLQTFGGSSSVGIDLAGTLDGLIYIRQDSILPIAAASMTSTSQILIGRNLIGDIDLAGGLAGNVTVGRFGPVAWNGDVFAGTQTITKPDYELTRATIGGGIVAHVPFNIYHADQTPLIPQGLINDGNHLPNNQVPPGLRVPFYGNVYACAGGSSGSNCAEVGWPDGVRVELDTGLGTVLNVNHRMDLIADRSRSDGFFSREIRVRAKAYKPLLPTPPGWVYRVIVDPNSDLRCDLGDAAGVTFVSVAPGEFVFTVQPDCNKNGTADELESPLPDCTRWGFCDADFDEDGFLDGFDYDSFVACFEGTVCPPGKDADFSGDGFVDGFDFEAFSDLYESGCGWD